MYMLYRQVSSQFPVGARPFGKGRQNASCNMEISAIRLGRACVVRNTAHRRAFSERSWPRWICMLPRVRAQGCLGVHITWEISLLQEIISTPKLAILPVSFSSVPSHRVSGNPHPNHLGRPTNLPALKKQRKLRCRGHMTGQITC